MKQRTEEWHQFRGKRITASKLACVLAKPTTKRYRDYMDEIIESLNGVPNFQDDPPWFWHGKEMEEEGISYYEWRMCREVDRGGIFVHPKYNFISCSPDWTEGKSGGGELKCHKSLEQYEISERKGIPSNHIPQVQGNLWITGRKWWNFVSYYRNDKKRLIHIYAVYPDIEYHKKLEQACLDFWTKIKRKIENGK